MAKLLTYTFKEELPSTGLFDNLGQDKMPTIR
jgi:hypothetical protein